LHSSIHVFSVQHGSAYIGTRQFYGLQILTLQREKLEGIVEVRRTDQFGRGRVSEVNGHAVRVVEIVVWVSVLTTAEMPDKLPLMVVLNNKIRALPVGHVKIAVRDYDNFGCWFMTQVRIFRPIFLLPIFLPRRSA